MKRERLESIWTRARDRFLDTREKISRFSIAQLWGLWLIALVLLLWLLLKD
jgi:hypothetical protein